MLQLCTSLSCFTYPSATLPVKLWINCEYLWAGHFEIDTQNRQENKQTNEQPTKKGKRTLFFGRLMWIWVERLHTHPMLNDRVRHACARDSWSRQCSRKMTSRPADFAQNFWTFHVVSDTVTWFQTMFLDSRLSLVIPD